MRHESNNYGCENNCQRQVQSLLRVARGYPDLNWEEGYVSGFTENLILLKVHTQFCPFVLYVFISFLLSILFYIILKFDYVHFAIVFYR